MVADGNVYLSSQFTDQVLKYDGSTGAYLGTFVTAGSGGVDAPTALLFRGDGYLYVSSYNTDAILRYDAVTGAFVDTFVTSASGGLNGPGDFAFGADGNLYVSGTNSVVKRFDGTTGAFIDDFTAVSAGGLGESIGLEFGPDGNLYVANFTEDEVLVFDGTSGALIGNYVGTGAGGLDGPASLVFAPSHQVAVVSPAPVLDLDADDSAASGIDFSTNWTEDAGAAAAVDSDTTLTDPDDANLSSLTVTINNLLDGAAEVLAADTTGTSVSASYNFGTGVLTLSGSDTVANYLTVLKTVTYDNSSDAPSTTTRSITFVASDGVNSSQVATTTVTMNSVNDAPVLDNSGTMTPTNVTEDDTNPAGDTVASIVASAGGDRITDGDGGALEGIAATGVDNTNGAWEYSTNSGATWNSFGAVSDSSAVLLDDSAKIRFVPNADYSGSAGNITFRAWDQTSGANGQTGVDVATNGGMTAFSSATESASLTVTPVNDSPLVGTNAGATVAEGSTGNVITTAMLNEADVDDGGAGLTYTITAATANGTLRNNGTALGAQRHIHTSRHRRGTGDLRPRRQRDAQ